MNEPTNEDINTRKENAEIEKILKSKQVQDFLALPKLEAIRVCLEWNKEVNGGKILKTENAIDCPIFFWVIHNNTKCHKEMVSNTAVCPLCGRPVCPDCMNHNLSEPGNPVKTLIGNIMLITLLKITSSIIVLLIVAIFVLSILTACKVFIQ